MTDPQDITPDDSVVPVFLDETPIPSSGDSMPLPPIDDQRRAAYQLRSDPLFFKWQRGEGSQQDWLDEITAVKADYPKD